MDQSAAVFHAAEPLADPVDGSGGSSGTATRTRQALPARAIAPAEQPRCLPLAPGSSRRDATYASTVHSLQTWKSPLAWKSLVGTDETGSARNSFASKRTFAYPIACRQRKAMIRAEPRFRKNVKNCCTFFLMRPRLRNNGRPLLSNCLGLDAGCICRAQISRISTEFPGTPKRHWRPAASWPQTEPIGNLSNASSPQFVACKDFHLPLSTR